MLWCCVFAVCLCYKILISHHRGCSIEKIYRVLLQLCLVYDYLRVSHCPFGDCSVFCIRFFRRPLIHIFNYLLSYCLVSVKLEGSVDVGCDHDLALYWKMFDSLLMRILFNGILQIRLRQYFAYPSCFCKCLSSGFKSEESISILFSLNCRKAWCARCCWTVCILKAFLHRMLLDQFCKNYLTSIVRGRLRETCGNGTN